MEATHPLKSEDRHHKQGQNVVYHGSHSLSGEPRTGIVRRIEMQLTMEVTHLLENRGQVL